MVFKVCKKNVVKNMIIICIIKELMKKHKEN